MRKEHDPSEEKRVYPEDVKPEDMPVFPVAAGEHYLPGLMVQAGLATSNGDARRLIEAKSVSFDGQKIRDLKAMVTVSAEHLLRTGKKNFAKIVVGPAAEPPELG